MRACYPLVALPLCLVAMIARRPDAITRPQFWAEDGAIFYQPAFDGRAAKALLVPWAGYLHVFPRLVAWGASLAPPEWAPGLFNLTALLVASASVWLFTLPLARPLIGSDGLRLAVALLFILGNPAVETYGNLTNAHWWMCLGALLLVAVPLQGRWLVPLACVFVALTTLSSPVPALYVPIALATMAVGGRRYWAAGFALVLGVAVQVGGRFWLAGKEPALPEWQGIVKLLELASDACHATLLHLFPGYAGASEIHYLLPWVGWLLAGLLFGFLVAGALRPWSWRQASLVSGAVYLLVSALMMAAVTRGCCPSSFLLDPIMPRGGRYVFVPCAMCVFLFGLAVQPEFAAPRLRARVAALVLFAAVALCSIAGVPPMILLDDLQWSQHVQEARERGTATIPINPGVPEWNVQLTMPRK
jgi:hypothetical protein